MRGGKYVSPRIRTHAASIDIFAMSRNAVDLAAREAARLPDSRISRCGCSLLSVLFRLDLLFVRVPEVRMSR